MEPSEVDSAESINKPQKRTSSNILEKKFEEDEEQISRDAVEALR